MAILYTPEEIQGVLRALRIKPMQGKVSTLEAARILTWRAKEEQSITITYTASAVRRHIQLGNLVAEPVSKRLNRYKVEDIFDLPLAPRRGYRPKKPSDTTDNPPEEDLPTAA